MSELLALHSRSAGVFILDKTVKYGLTTTTARAIVRATMKGKLSDNTRTKHASIA